MTLAIIDVKDSRFERCGNIMLFSLLIWCGFCTLEVLNDTCGIGIDVASWYTTARSVAFQIMYAFLVFSIYISNPKALNNYLIVSEEPLTYCKAEHLSVICLFIMMQPTMVSVLLQLQ